MLELEIIGLPFALHHRVISHIPVAVSSSTILSERSPLSNIIIHCSWVVGVPDVHDDDDFQHLLNLIFDVFLKSST